MSHLMHAGGVSYSHMIVPTTTATSTPRRPRKFASPAPRANRIGLPGSKRHQRWLNRSFLMEQEGELELEDFNVFDRTPSLFASLLDEENRRKWESFIAASDDQQEKILKSMNPHGEISQLHITELDGQRYAPATEIWIRMDKSVRRLLRKQINNEFLELLDRELGHYMAMPSDDSRTFLFTDSYHRLLCHAACEFYSLKSRSEDTASGERIVIVSKSTNGIRPSDTLMNFLQMCRC